MQNYTFNSSVLQSLAHSSAFYLIRISIDGKYTFVNDYFRQKFSHISTTFIGEPIENSIVAEDIPKCEAAGKKCLQQIGHMERVKIRKPYKDGHQYWSDWEFMACYIEGQTQPELVCIGYDVTEQSEQRQKLIEHAREIDKNIAEVRDINLELDKVNFELDHFVYRISHDLRAPLASCLGLISLSLEQDDLQIVKDYLRMQQHSLNRLNQYIFDIIDHAKNIRLPVNYVQVDVAHELRKLAAHYKYLYPSVELQLSTTGDAIVRTDPLRFTIIAANLLSNAFKYQDKEKQQAMVKVALNNDGSTITLAVEDNGIGIPEQYQQQIFEMFFRATELSRGTGLGLYILRECLEKMGGKIELVSSSGVGSTFTVQIPYNPLASPA